MRIALALVAFDLACHVGFHLPSPQILISGRRGQAGEG